MAYFRKLTIENTTYELPPGKTNSPGIVKLSNNGSKDPAPDTALSIDDYNDYTSGLAAWKSTVDTFMTNTGNRLDTLETFTSSVPSTFATKESVTTLSTALTTHKNQAASKATSGHVKVYVIDTMLIIKGESASS